MTSRGGVFLGYLHNYTYSASFGRSLMDLVHWEAMNGGERLAQWGAMQTQGYELVKARNDLAAEFLQTKCEWFFAIDSDMGFAPNTLALLLEAAESEHVPIVGALCFAYKEQAMDSNYGMRSIPLPTIYTYMEGPNGEPPDFRGRAHYPVNTLIRSAATGMACVLIHRTVFEKIAEKYGNAWFDRLPGPTGLRGEDISFCMRAGACGFPVYVHTGVRTNHHKNIWVSEVDFWESFHAPPALETVDVVVPTVKPRSGNIPDLARSLKATTGMARLILVVDDEDHAAELKEWGETVVFPGSFARKINHAYKWLAENDPAPWMQVVGDDCRFHPGWLDHQQHVARSYEAKVVGSNDMANARVVRGEHATHWMINRSYIDELGASWDGPGVVAHEGYRHWYVDDEIVAVGKQRGVFQPALGAKIEHFHPMTGKAEVDEVYEKNDRYAAQDHDLFQNRLKAHGN